MESDAKSRKDTFRLQLNKIRGRKQLNPARLTGANAPSTAFIIVGHGRELVERKIVPPGCILVVQVHSGEINYLRDNFFINIFNDPEKEKFKNPITNYKYINDKINSVREYYTPLAIYREGDEYPDFLYKLLCSWDSEDYPEFFHQSNSYKLQDSGIVKYPFNKGSILLERGLAVQNVTNVITNYTDPGKGNFLSIYNKSEYPTIDELAQIIDSQKDLITIDEIINSPLIDNVLTKKQSEIFEILGPGVYYNLICRATDDSLRIKDPNTNREVLNNKKRPLVNESGHINRSKKEILQGIEEAELHRKNLIAKLNKNNPESNPTSLIYKEALFNAVRNDNLNFVKSLLDKGVNVDTPWHDGSTALIVASQLGHLGIVHELLKRGANVDVVIIDGNTPLIFAIAFGHLEIVGELIAYGANVNIARPADLVTPLMYASQNGNMDMVRFLCINGADPFSVNIDGQTASEYTNNPDIKFILEQTKASILEQTKANTNSGGYRIRRKTKCKRIRRNKRTARK